MLEYLKMMFKQAFYADPRPFRIEDEYNYEYDSTELQGLVDEFKEEENLKIRQDEDFKRIKDLLIEELLNSTSLDLKTKYANMLRWSSPYCSASQSELIQLPECIVKLSYDNSGYNVRVLDIKTPEEWKEENEE